MKSNTMAIAAKCWLSEGESVSSPATDTIGATAIPLSSVQPPSSIADRRFWMEKLLSKTATVLLYFEALSSALRRQPHSIILYAFELRRCRSVCLASEQVPFIENDISLIEFAREKVA